MTTIICHECGTENDSSAEICIECGVSLTLENLIEKANIEEPIGDELDRLSAADTDLPGLLHALKQEDIPVDEADGTEHAPEENKATSDLTDSDENEVLPDWLNRIRQRASAEDDSKGKLIKKLSAAQESLANEKRESQHDDFSSLIEQIKEGDETGTDESELNEETVPEEDITESGNTPEWLNKIRKISGVSQTDRDMPPVPGGDSLLQWLMDLENGKEILKGIPKPGLDFIDDGYQGDFESISARSGFDGGVTQEMLIGGLETSAVNVTREEQTQADQLQAIIVDETAVRPIRRPTKKSSHWFRRLLFALLLIGGLSIALFAGETGNLVDRTLKPQNQALLTWVAEKPDNTSILLVFDYQAGYMQEINLIALPILEQLIDKTTEISVISSSVSGKLLAHQLLNAVDTDKSIEFEDLGFFPAASYGAYGLLNRNQGTWPFVDLPDPVQEFPMESFDGIVILSGSDEGARSWVEQLSILSPETPINLILAAQAGPLMLPYWESGQVTGMISGISEAAAVEEVYETDSGISLRWRAYQVGILLLIGVMLIGAFFVVERTPNNDEGKRHDS